MVYKFVAINEGQALTPDHFHLPGGSVIQTPLYM